MNRVNRAMFALVVLFVIGNAPRFAIHGQTFYGSIVGRITDSSGGVMPNASVTLTNNGTSERRSVPADTDGNYRFVNLVPGNYKIDIEIAGFKHYTRDQIIVEVESAVRADVSMQVGDVTQQLEVTSEAPLLQTENASLSQVVSGRAVEELPLNGRNVLNLVNYVPGVVPQGSSEGSLTGKNVFAAGNYQIGGGTANQSATLFDGVAVNVAYGNMVALVPSQDVVSEFRVQTNNNSAEYGRFSGGVINIASKSGSNDFHGSAYEFFRNKVLNAGTFFANATGQGKPAFSQNQFGATFSGPIRKDKTFFFFGYEGYRQRQGVLFLYTVPTPAQLRGDFSNFRNANGAQIPIYDPLTQCGQLANPACPASGAQRSPFPGNVIPANRLNPIAQNYIKFPYWAAPNIAGQPFTNLFNFSTNASTGGNNDQVNFRGDHSVSEKQRLFGRYTRWSTTNQRVDVFRNGLYAGDPYSPEGFITNQAILGDTYSLNPNTTLDVRLGYTRWDYNRTPGTLGMNISQAIGFPSYYNQLDALRGLTGSTTIPTMSITGYNNISTGLLLGVANNYVITPSLIKVTGRHTWKFGAELRRMELNYYQDNNPGGTFTFNNLFTSQNALSPGATGDGVASFLLGYAQSGTVQSSLFTATQMYYQGYYVNDTWQVNNRLTLTLGVRWEIPGVYLERYDRQTTFDPYAVNPVLAQKGITVNGAPVRGAYNLVSSNAHPDRGLNPEHWNLFAPRVGIAYRVNDKTVLRVGAGVFFLPADSSFPEGPDQAAVSYINNAMVSTINSSVTAVNTLSNPYPNGFLALPQRDPGYQATLLGLQGIRSPLGNHPYPRTYQWNFSVQHQFPKDIAVEAAYTGLRGMHLPRGNPAVEYDQISPAKMAALGTQLQQQVPNPFYGTITTGPLSLPTVQRGQLELPFPQYQSTTDFGGYVGDSIYHSLQVKAEKRFSKGGNILAAYTFSKILTNTETLTSWLEGGSTGTGAAGVQDYTNLRAERALSSFDSRQRLTVGYVVDLPFGKGKRFASGVSGVTDKLVSGWGVNGLITFQDGLPLAITATPNLTGFNTGLRPNVINGCNKTIDGAAQARLNRWFNTACFSVPGAFTFGSESRTDPNLRGQGIANYDFALFKRTNVTERVNVEFRTEAFNLFNRVKFGNPNLTATTAANATFGVVSTQINTPRLIQLALRLRF